MCRPFAFADPPHGLRIKSSRYFILPSYTLYWIRSSDSGWMHLGEFTEAAEPPCDQGDRCEVGEENRGKSRRGHFLGTDVLVFTYSLIVGVLIHSVVWIEKYILSSLLFLCAFLSLQSP